MKQLRKNERAIVVNFESPEKAAEWFAAARAAGLFDREAGLRPADGIDVAHGAYDVHTRRRLCFPSKDPAPLWVVHPAGTQTVRGQTVPIESTGDPLLDAIAGSI